MVVMVMLVIVTNVEVLELMPQIVIVLLDSIEVWICLLNVFLAHIGAQNVLLIAVSVPLTELNNHIVSVEMDTMMFSELKNAKNVLINVPFVNNMNGVMFVLKTESVFQIVIVITDSMPSLDNLNVHLVDIHV
jgi:hypothetical protein